MADDIEIINNGGEGNGAEPGVLLIDIEEEMRRSYLGYAVSTLISRALPPRPSSASPSTATRYSQRSASP